MLQFPPVQNWNAIHPLIIHFPIVLLLLVPFLIAAGALRPSKRGRTILYLALIIMAAGTGGTYLAVSSGEAAAQMAERSPQIDAVLHHHEQLAEATSIGFSVLTIIFAALLILPEVLKKTANRVASTALPLVFLLLYGGGVLLLTNTAHNGARLVHEFGVTALMKPSPIPVAGQEANQLDAAPIDQKKTDDERN